MPTTTSPLAVPSPIERLDPKPAELFAPAEPTTTSSRVRKYFETSGFSRWTAIYGTGDIPPIWKIIRDGHQLAIDKVVDWVKTDKSHTALDAGCGTGNLSIELANHGFEVDAFDVSPQMIHFAKYISTGRTKGIPPRFQTGDIASLAGSAKTYDLVVCLDVLFHYPYEEVVPMLQKLAALSSHKLVGSFALRTVTNDFWMKIGGRFHAKDRMTKLHLFSYNEIEQVLYRAGFKMMRKKRVKFFFYDSFVFEAVRIR
jgi:magnesium-protoporphyrin O-methyltransferase